MSAPTMYTLRHAIVVTTRASDGAEREEVVKQAGEQLTLRRPKARDMKLMDSFDGREIEGTIHMIAALSGLAVHEVEMIDAEDFGSLGECVGAFMESGPKTGTTA